MKKLLLALLVAAVIAAPTAEAAYLGSLQQALPYTLEVTTTGRVAITIVMVTKRGNLEVDDILVFEPTTPAQERTIPRNVVRLHFLVAATQNGNGSVRISQGPILRHEVPADPDADIVVDTIP